MSAVAVAHVRRVAQHLHTPCLLKRAKMARRFIGGPIVHDEYVGIGRSRQRLRQHFFNAGRLIVHGDDD